MDNNEFLDTIVALGVTGMMDEGEHVNVEFNNGSKLDLNKGQYHYDDESIKTAIIQIAEIIKGE